MFRLPRRHRTHPDPAARPPAPYRGGPGRVHPATGGAIRPPRAASPLPLALTSPPTSTDPPLIPPPAYTAAAEALPLPAASCYRTVRAGRGGNGLRCYDGGSINRSLRVFPPGGARRTPGAVAPCGAECRFAAPAAPAGSPGIRRVCPVCPSLAFGSVPTGKLAPPGLSRSQPRAQVINLTDCKTNRTGTGYVNYVPSHKSLLLCSLSWPLEAVFTGRKTGVPRFYLQP